ncbi:MAG: site-specific DNA-methyltransferase [Alphaproteobacteria bacterium]|nr:site-specific DNA-methyltransferase [Alphaproteobacteria bacterium]
MDDLNIKIKFPDGISTWGVEDLIPYENNPRTHSQEQLQQLVSSMIEFGFTNPILVDKVSKEIIAGHGRLMAAQMLGLKKVPVIALSHLSEAQRRKLIIADNQLALNAGWDEDLLSTEISALKEMGEDLDVLGFDDEFMDEMLNSALNSDFSSDEEPEEMGSLVEKFGVPPFSILEVRKGYWQDRKRQWKNLIGENGESRTGTLFQEGTFIAEMGTVSILDPVLCEIIVSWFGLGKGTKCVDPFSGDTSFGFVSAVKGCEFTGIELRQEQAKLNQVRCDKSKLNAKYICDDGQNVLKHVEEKSQDLLFSCPPYFDLEVYSDLDNDASNQESYEEFFKILDNAFSEAIKTLKDNRFAAIVVSNIRNQKTGFYRNFVDDIIRLFQRNGMAFYNDIILVDSLGSAPRRAAHNMKNRKVVKVHQNVLIFYKGDSSKIKEIYKDDVFVDNFLEEENHG